MSVLFFICLTIFLIATAVLCLVILIQDSKSMGLGASFGGDSGDSFFGTSTADVLKKFTGILAAVFMIGCIVLSLWSGSLGRSKSTLPVTIEEASDK